VGFIGAISSARLWYSGEVSGGPRCCHEAGSGGLHLVRRWNLTLAGRGEYARKLWELRFKTFSFSIRALNFESFTKEGFGTYVFSNYLLPPIYFRY
jgi:hypothetical protein